MLVTEFQNRVAAWSDKNFTDALGIDVAKDKLLGVSEEVGELCHAILKLSQGIRMDEPHLENAQDAVGDIMLYLADFCHRMGFCMEECMVTALETVEKRNWKDNPATG